MDVGTVWPDAGDLSLCKDLYLALAGQAMPDALFVHDHQGCFVEANRRACESLGYARGELLAMTLADVEPELDLPLVQAVWWRLQSSQTVTRQGLQRRKDGSAFPVEVRSGLLELEGRRLYVGVVRDITERRQAERLLAESEARMRSLFASSPDPAWIIEDNQFVECNDAAVAMLGYESAQHLRFVHPSKLSPPVQPDGQPSFAKAERMMRLALDQGIHRFEWAHLRADGGEFLAEVTLSAIMLQGRRAIYCTWRDITARKRAEVDQQLAASVFHTTQEGIIITAADGTILSVNPAFTQITGFSAEEAVGRTPRLLKSHHHDHYFYTALWRELLDRGRWQGELWNRRKSGEAYLQMLTITGVAGTDGRYERFVAVFTDVTELRRKDEHIRYQAYHDALTGLPNRVLLEDRLGHAIEVARRQNTRLAVLFMDLDRFKLVNDSLGHQEGDKLLQLTARRLQAAVRQSDTVGRLGGDEFIVIVTGFDNAGDVAQVAEKIVATVADPFALSSQVVHVGTSIGIAVFPEDGEDGVTLMKHADAAMYQAKSAGRSTFRFYDGGLNALASQRLEMEVSLRQALDQGEFRLFYQPKIYVPDGRLCGAEALLRWCRPDGSLVSPADFIPIAEESGLIVPLGYWVMEEVCRQISLWRTEGLTAVPVSLNLSPRQFRDGTLLERLLGILDAAAMPGELIEVELTEGTVMEDPDQAIVVLRRLRDRGIGVSVDDFGTGYSSLAYLKRLPICTIKIDASFVANLGIDPEDAAIARTIIGLAETLKLEVVAEGVETVEQLTFLREMGCRVVQGFYYGRPVPPEEFRHWLVL